MMSIKRKNTDAIDSDIALKTICLKIDEPDQNLENKSGTLLGVKESNVTGFRIEESNRLYPSKFISMMYKIHLSTLCTLRKLQYRHKYPSVSISCEDPEIDRFKDIVIRYQAKSVHIQVVDDHFIGSNIGYSELFSKNQTFSLNIYYNSFVKYCICKSFNFLRSIEHLIIYTNLSLNLAENQALGYCQKSRFYPFKFEAVASEELIFLKEFFESKTHTPGSHYFQFSQDETSKRELFGRLELSCAMKKAVEDRHLSNTSIDKIKDEFVKKLIFAVDQPPRELLFSTIMSEISNTSYNFTSLQEEVLNGCSVRSPFVYDLNFLILALKDVISQKKMCLNYESHNTSSLITVGYRDKRTFIKIIQEYRKIDSKMLFPPTTYESKSRISLNVLFAHFIKELERNENIKFFIIYTNAQLDLSNRNVLRGSKSVKPIRLTCIDIKAKRFKILRYLSSINNGSLYQLEPNDMNVLSLLRHPLNQQANHQEMSDDANTLQEIMQVKKTFLHKLIFATNQPNAREMRCMIQNTTYPEIIQCQETFQEVVLRWCESHSLGFITSDVARRILDDIKNNRITYQKFQEKDIATEIRFAKRIAGPEGSSSFNSFLQYLISGEGKKYLEDFQKSGLRLASLSTILNKTGSRASGALTNLYNLLYDHQRKESSYLPTLRKNNIKFITVSTFLQNTRYCASGAFKDLFSMWFDHDGNKTFYLYTLEREKISLSSLSSILGGAGLNVAKAFKNFFYLLFTENGSKTELLNSLEGNGIVLAHFSTILSNTGNKAAEALTNFSDLLFNKNGENSFYLETLQNNGFSLKTFGNLLFGLKSQAVSVFKDVFYLMFDRNGNKSRYLQTMEREGIEFAFLIRLLRGSGSKVTEAFKDLYNVWFDRKGNKTMYLGTLSANEIDLRTMVSILHSSGFHAAQAFKDLFHLWITQDGKRTPYLETLHKYEISIATVGNMLKNTGSSAADTYKAMHHILFDDNGNKTERFDNLERVGLSITNIATMLTTSTYQFESAFNDLYNLWFDSHGAKTRYLQTIERYGLPLSTTISILHSCGSYAAKAYKTMYDCWFDEHDNKTRHLQVFERNGLSLMTIMNILSQGGRYSAQIFLDLHDLWFDEEGKKSLCIQYLENEGVDLPSLANVMKRSGPNAVSNFRNFYDFCFDSEGNLTRFLQIFKENNVTLPEVMKIFTRLTINSVEILKNLYFVFFTEVGDETQYLMVLKANRVQLKEIVDIVRRTNSMAATIVIDLYNTWFDDEGNKKQCLRLLEENGQCLPDTVKLLAGSGSRALSRFSNMV